GLVFGAALLKGSLTIEATKAELERREKDPVKAHVTEERFYRYWDNWLTTGETPHLFHLDLATKSLRDLTPEATWWLDWMEPAGSYDIAPDASEIAIGAIEVEPTSGLIRTMIWTVPLRGAGMPKCLTREHPADDMRPRYTPDGRSIVFGQQLDPTFYADRVRLVRYDRASGAFEEIAPEWKLSASQWELAHDGSLIIEAEDEARVSLFRLRGTGVPERIARGGSISGAAAAGERVWYVSQDLSAPPELFHAALDGASAQRATTFTDPVTKQFALGEVRELEFEGAYGAKVQ